MAIEDQNDSDPPAEASERRGEVTLLLAAARDGNDDVSSQLFPVIYDELLGLARSLFRDERDGHTLGPTALVHEAYLRLVDSDTVEWESRAHFFRVAARAMRRALINHSRAKRTAKRGGDWDRITLSGLQSEESGAIDLVALDECLEQLEALDERQCRVVELRYFAGFTIEETAEILGVGTRTVELDWSMARAWLHRRLSTED